MSEKNNFIPSNFLLQSVKVRGNGWLITNATLEENEKETQEGHFKHESAKINAIQKQEKCPSTKWHDDPG
jgi:hypothetical protein